MTALADSAELRAIQARARAWVRVLRLPFRQQRWRGQVGSYAGTGAGSSLEFHDHRAYLPGDDPRQINWQAYARTGQHSMKVYREEVRPLADVVLDASASMFAYPEKERRTAELLAFVVESCLNAGAAPQVFALSGRERVRLEAGALLDGSWPRKLGGLTKGGEEPPYLEGVPWRSGAFRIWISDLLFPAPPDALLAILGRQRRGVVLCPYSRREAMPGWDGNYEFIDAESGHTQAQKVPETVLKDYQEAYRRHFEIWKQTAAKCGAALARVAAEGDFLTAVRAEGVSGRVVEVA